MSSATLTLIIVGVVVVIAVIAWLLYKAGFTVREITAKLGLVEAKMERATGADPSSTETSAGRLEVSQTAGKGGVINKSGISAPAQSKAQIDQEATGEGSRIDDSPIKLS